MTPLISAPLFSGYTDVYYYNRDSEKFITINQGGTSSSKTYSILQVLVKMAIEKKRIIQIFGQDFPNLYLGAITDFKRLISDSPILEHCLENPKLDRGPFKFRNGSVIQFTTAQNFQDAKSGKRDVLFINEANGIPYDIAFELIARTTEKVFIDYNPNSRFWVHYELLDNPDVELIISNFTHNKYCPEQIKLQILSWKRKYEELGTTYWKNKWEVYGLGKTGAVEGVVFDNLNVCTFFPSGASHVTYGLDFGFKNNYTALVKVGIFNNALYGKELLYEQKLNSVVLGERLLDIGISKQAKIMADPAHEEAIIMLQEKGFNVLPAKKGAGSIKAGIELIQSKPLYITQDSKNWWTEAENYKYKKDANGKFLNEPIDAYNDCFIAGTLVTTSKGQKPIEKIEVGELVLTSEGYNRVVHTWDNGLKEVTNYIIEVEGKKINITCTDNHKIKTEKGWKQIQHLQEQDVVYLCKNLEDYQELTTKKESALVVKPTLATDIKNKEVVVKAVVKKISRKYVGYRPTYDLMVENCHEYFVDNLGVSNCFDATRYIYVELFGLRNKKPMQNVNQGYKRRFTVI